MKLIIAVIQPSKLEDVKAALNEVEVVRLTIMDVQGFGRQKGQTEMYRGREITVNLLRKVQLQIAVNEAFVEPTINAIIKGGRTLKVSLFFPHSSLLFSKRAGRCPAAKRPFPFSLFPSL